MVLRYINEIPVPEPLNGRAPELFKGPKPTAEITGLPNMTATCDPCGRWEIAVREEFRRFGNPECQNCGNPHVNWAAAMIPEELREKAREIYNAARGRPATRGGPAGATNRSNNAEPSANGP